MGSANCTWSLISCSLLVTASLVSCHDFSLKHKLWFPLDFQEITMWVCVQCGYVFVSASENYKCILSLERDQSRELSSSSSSSSRSIADHCSYYILSLLSLLDLSPETFNVIKVLKSPKSEAVYQPVFPMFRSCKMSAVFSSLICGILRMFL